MIHQLLPTAAMPCGRCRKWADGIHQLSSTDAGLSVEYVGACCCPTCRPAEPLPEREVETLAGTQGEMFK